MAGATRISKRRPTARHVAPTLASPALALPPARLRLVWTIAAPLAASFTRRPRRGHRAQEAVVPAGERTGEHPGHRDEGEIAEDRRAAARGLGQLQLAGLPPRQRQPIAARCLEALLAGCGDGEWVVRYAVVVGLECLAPQLLNASGPAPLAPLRAALEQLRRHDPDGAAVVALRAALALDRLAALGAPEATDG